MSKQCKVTFKTELMFPGNYLAAPDLKGQDVRLTIAKVSQEEVYDNHGGTELKWVLTFDKGETDKKMILNRVSHPNAIAHLWGNKAEDWIGKRITLYPTRVPFGKGMVDAIRVRETKPPPKVTPPDADELAAADAG